MQPCAGMIASHLELHRYGTGRGSRVVTALTLLKSHLFKYQGHVSAALVLGGVDLNGPHLFTVSIPSPYPSHDSLLCKVHAALHTCTATLILYRLNINYLQASKLGKCKLLHLYFFFGAKVLIQCWHVGVPTWVH